MKKTIYIFLIILISLFPNLLEHVKAADEVVPTFVSKNLSFHNLGNMTDEEKQELLGTTTYYDRAKNYALKSCGTDSYYIYRNLNSGGFNVACFNKQDYIASTFNVYAVNKSQMDNGMFAIEADVFIKNSKKAYMFNDTYNGTAVSRSQYHYMTFGPYNNSQLGYTSNVSSMFAYESNIPIEFIYNNLYGSYSTLVGNSDDKFYYYNAINIDGKDFVKGNMIISNNGKYQTMDRPLSIKKSFNSGTNAPNMGKIVVDFKEENVDNGRAKIRLQYGSNDSNSENTPVFQSYKIYGISVLGKEKEYKEIMLDDTIYISDEKLTTEADGNESIYEITINMPSDLCVYTDYQIEFYFTNTQNFYLYALDNIDNSDWNDVSSFLNNYVMYEFPDNCKYAVISSENEENIEKIYFPTYLLNTDKIRLSNLNIESKSLGNLYVSNTFSEDDYYSYFDFSFRHSSHEVLLLERKETNDKAYFYVPKSYYVNFVDTTEDSFIIKTPDGFEDHVKEDFGDIFDKEQSIIDKTINSILTPFMDLINKKLPIINQLYEIIKSFKYDKNNLPKPSLIIDFSFLGGTQYEFFSDEFFNAYDKYRDILNLFLYMGISFLTIPKTINYVKGYFGGGE